MKAVGLLTIKQHNRLRLRAVAEALASQKIKYDNELRQKLDHAKAESNRQLTRPIVVVQKSQSAGRDESIPLLLRRMLPLTNDLELRIRNDVALRAPALNIDADQWKMILSTDPATCVVAGAGSGKSTCLMLRVIVLHVYLKIPWSHLVVFTFTKNSRVDFIKRLRKLLASWGEPINDNQAKKVVRTFHSMAFSMYRDCVDGSPKILEYLNEDGGLSITDEGNIENVIAEEASDPLRKRLIAAYQNAFLESSDFRDAIKDLYVQSLLQQRAEPEEHLASKAKWVATYDRSLADFLVHRWGEIAPHLWPPPPTVYADSLS